jgi:hypothetical protein
LAIGVPDERRENGPDMLSYFLMKSLEAKLKNDES